MCCFGSNMDDEDDVYFATLRRDGLPIDVKIIEKAKKNDAYSLFFIGDEYYRKGLASEAGKTSNWYRKALTWYTKAADNGFPDAQFNLGYMHENGVGVQYEDFQLAIEYYIKASTLGYTSAFYRLGYIYEKGIGVAKNYDVSFDWYKQAAEQGDIFAQFKVGNMYKMGMGVAINPVMALTWFSRCANQGDRDAQLEVTELKNQGYRLEEERSRKSSVKKPKFSSRNNSIHRQHQSQREAERRDKKNNRKLSISSKNGSNAHNAHIEVTKIESDSYQQKEEPVSITQSRKKYQQAQRKSGNSTTENNSQANFKPNLKDDMNRFQVKNTSTKTRFRDSKVYLDDHDHDRDFNLDDEPPENDIYYDDPNEK